MEDASTAYRETDLDRRSVRKHLLEGPVKHAQIGAATGRQPAAGEAWSQRVRAVQVEHRGWREPLGSA